MGHSKFICCSSWGFVQWRKWTSYVYWTIPSNLLILFKHFCFDSILFWYRKIFHHSHFKFLNCLHAKKVKSIEDLSTIYTIPKISNFPPRISYQLILFLLQLVKILWILERCNEYVSNSNKNSVFDSVRWH